MKTRTVITLILLLTFAAAAQTKISCVGTSITAGVPGSFSYPQFLSQLLGNDYIVTNNGQSTITLYAYLGSAAAPGVFGAYPDIITIELGTNDSRAGFSRTGFTSAYNALIDSFLTIRPVPEIRLVLPLPILANPYNLSPDTMSLAIVPIIKGIAAQRHFSIIDCNTPMTGHPELYESDGVHPLRFEPAGYDTLAHIFFRALTAATSTVNGESRSITPEPQRSRLLVHGSMRVLCNGGSRLFDINGRQFPPNKEQLSCRRIAF